MLTLDSPFFIISRNSPGSRKFFLWRGIDSRKLCDNRFDLKLHYSFYDSCFGKIMFDICFHFVAGHCINGEDIVRSGYLVDSVRLGEHDLRLDPDCQEVIIANNFFFTFFHSITHSRSFGM